MCSGCPVLVIIVIIILHSFSRDTHTGGNESLISCVISGKLLPSLSTEV